MNKKSKWEFDYNLQIAVDDYKGIIVSSSLTQNPTDVFEIIPQIEQAKSIFGELPPPKIHRFQQTIDIQQTKHRLSRRKLLR